MSKEAAYRLSDSTAAEPLVNDWVAWSHVISPVACSLHLQNYQLGILRSYLDDPKVHVDACKHPELRSGRFVDIPARRAAEVRDFLAGTEARMRDNLKLAASLVEFHNRLTEQAKGLSLDPYYAELPPELQGHVELVYDYYHRPTVRLYESLLYESNFYKEDLQSLRLFRQARDDSRPFFMSTPRLVEEQQIAWDVPFRSPQVDELFALDDSPKPLGHVRELLGLRPADDRLLREMLTEGAAPRPQRWEGERGVRVRYIGHACVLVEWGGVSVLTDPCLGIIPSEGGAERFTYRDLPEKIDYVLVTHNHHDHFCVESLLRLRHKVGCLVVPRAAGYVYGDMSLKLMAKKIGFKNVVEIDALDSIKLPGGEIVGVPFMGEHADLAHGKTAYAILARGASMLFAADSDCLDVNMYRHIRRILGPIRTVFLGMECVGAPLSWSCGTFLPQKLEHAVNQSRRYKGSDSVRGFRLLEAVGAERIFVYAMGLEPWLEHFLGLAYKPEATQLREAKQLLAHARERGFADARLLSGKCEIHLPD